jgi:hypothetical protein
LFNLRHAQTRNVIERIFGVVKKRWVILAQPPQYSMAVQARIPCALAALHNFILSHDSTDLNNFSEEDVDLDPGQHHDSLGSLADSTISREERSRAANNRDRIAQEMWNQYQQYIQDHSEE